MTLATQMVWPWKLQSSHLDSSNIFQKVLSHSPVSSLCCYGQGMARVGNSPRSSP